MLQVHLKFSGIVLLTKERKLHQPWRSKCITKLQIQIGCHIFWNQRSVTSLKFCCCWKNLHWHARQKHKHTKQSLRDLSLLNWKRHITEKPTKIIGKIRTTPHCMYISFNKCIDKHKCVEKKPLLSFLKIKQKRQPF